MLDGTLQDADRILGIRLAVDLESLRQAVRRIVGFIQVIPLNVRGFFERKTGFLVWIPLIWAVSGFGGRSLVLVNNALSF